MNKKQSFFCLIRNITLLLLFYKIPSSFNEITIINYLIIGIIFLFLFCCMFLFPITNSAETSLNKIRDDWFQLDKNYKIIIIVIISLSSIIFWPIIVILLTILSVFGCANNLYSLFKL